tara:strand:+ start:3348 stop:3539 length:192 start_codon:yes stop_codon:yes gene_type:complete
MPIKFKKSTKTFNRQTGKTSVEHYYMRSTPLADLYKYIKDPNGTPRLKQKVRNEIARRFKADA